MGSRAVADYLAKKAELESIPVLRPTCLTCRKPELTCYCADLRPFVSRPRVAIFMHPQEEKHPVGTGRMTHQCIENSSLIVDVKFDQNARARALLDDPKLYPMILYPGPRSVNLSQLDLEARHALIPEGREPLLCVVDGTWHHARKMLHHSPQLQRLPKISFTPPGLSGFLVRKQPREECFSTIEAVHEVLKLFGHEHEALLDVFNGMVAKQLSFRGTGKRSRHSAGYLARKARRQKWKAEKQRLRERGLLENLPA